MCLLGNRDTTPAPSHARSPVAQPAADAVVSDGLSVSVTPSAISAPAHSLLDTISRLEEATTERFVYRLDSQAAHESFEDGLALKDILDDWDRLMPIPMPEAMQAELTAWWEAYGRIRIFQDMTDLLFPESSQYDHTASRQERGNHFKRRVFGSGANKRNQPAFHVMEKSILLSLVETVDFIHKQNRVLTVEVPPLFSYLDDRPDFLHSGQHC